MDPFNGLHYNRFGLVPYPVEGKWRRIIDLSVSRGNSVSDFLTQVATVMYTSVDDAVAFIVECSRSTRLEKLDIKSHFEFLPFGSGERFYFGMLGRY